MHLENKTLDKNSLLEFVDQIRRESSVVIDPDKQIELGQFFTSSKIASLMASMFNEGKRTVRLLDAGAGVGSLSAAFIVEMCCGEIKPKEISIVAYEKDPILLSFLFKTREFCNHFCKQIGVKLNWEILNRDFIEESITLLRNNEVEVLQFQRFDCAILNPPYRKLHSNSLERKLLKGIDIETSNLYSAFVILAMRLLKRNGELVAITPRSFCNGPYFKSFRIEILNETTFRHIHTFDSRRSTFSEDGVQQENIIFKLIKGKPQNNYNVTISSSFVGTDEIAKYNIRYDQFVQPNDKEKFIRILKNDSEYQISDQIDRLGNTLEDLGISVSTGKVVDFRSKEYLRKDSFHGTVPLIYSSHFEDGFVKWPKVNSKKQDSIIQNHETERLLLPSGFYVLVKRFSSKEERRRVVAAIYDPRKVAFSKVGFENHVNYYHINGEGLTEGIAKGLAMFLNSSLIDSYLRQFNGHTQVNATDLRNLKYPNIEQLEKIGKRIGIQFPEQNDIDLMISELF
ncbi:Eco57I restriction-modification methylase domain-containing protein [Paenibacillus sp. N3/727]|uniref:Eco57I restriction-modification methylase domain-containing protein n=1 Tax=Paenibacillus sp. N3/727 TaxID=2925845 RepID=UPI001F53DDBD|nr:Eco57I restriction-modification methylase domain-containing protein [Paenibacillus sp. N3/727]UNK18423.1 Eco57I restriction-modification methylase domain-containing protein [Paenibacillus sp. N3/727]